MEGEAIYKQLKSRFQEKQLLIKSQLEEFKEVFNRGDDKRVFEELAFCILTSAAGPKMGSKSVNAIKDILMNGEYKELYERLLDIHKYPEKAQYIVHTRDYLKRKFELNLKELILSFSDPQERRDFFASNRDIKGIGYLQASHFLRNIGFFGYAIVDKNILRSLHDYGIIENNKPPSTRNKYLQIEVKMKSFAEKLGISIDELDLLLWSERTGHIPV